MTVRRPVVALPRGQASIVAAALWLIVPAIASAQVWIGSDVPRRGSLDVSAGAVWTGGFELGSRSAEETRNTGTGTGAFTLFTTDSRMTAAIGAQGRLGVYLARMLSVEGGIQYSRPRVSTRAGNDTEDAPEATLADTMTRYLFEGSLVIHLTGLSFAGGRGVPFLSGGGGYVRELHERNELIETGREYHGGAGLKLWLGRGAHRVGVRTDVGVSMREGTFDFSDSRRTVPTAGASLIYLF